MQSTGQASTQAVSLVPIQGSAITYAIGVFSQVPIHNTADGETQLIGCQRLPCPSRARFLRRMGGALWARDWARVCPRSADCSPARSVTQSFPCPEPQSFITLPL